MSTDKIKENWVKSAKWGINLFGLRVLFPRFMFRKRKQELWDKDVALRKSVYKNLFLGGTITAYEYRDLMQDEWNKQQ